MQPPEKIDVLDQVGGFTAITRYQGSEGTLWRPGWVLKHGTVGTLQSVNENSFFQGNDDVTQAVYKVSHYRYPVVLWFSNQTGERIA